MRKNFRTIGWPGGNLWSVAIGAVLFGLLALTMTDQVSARVMISEVKEKISAADYQKFKYLFRDFKPAISKDDLLIHKTKPISIIRIQNNKYCDKDSCITFVVWNCEKKICPYSAAPAGREFSFSDNLFSHFGNARRVSFVNRSEPRNSSSIVFLVSPEFVAVTSSDIIRNYR